MEYEEGSRSFDGEIDTGWNFISADTSQKATCSFPILDDSVSCDHLSSCRIRPVGVTEI
jgi:hypothetical protein